MPDVDDEQLRQMVAEGLSQREIARRTGLARATLYRRFQRLGMAPGQAPAPQVPPVPPVAHASQVPASPTAPAPPTPPAVTFVAVPEIQEILTIVRDLQTRVGALEQAPVAPALPAPPAAHGPHATTAAPAPERKDIQQWTIRVSKAWIEYVKQVAYERRMNPSEIVEECLWTALSDHHSSTPAPS